MEDVFEGVTLIVRLPRVGVCVALLNVIPQHFAQGRVQQVRCRVVQRRATAQFRVNFSREAIAHREGTTLDDTQMQELISAGNGVRDPEGRLRVPHDALVTDLAT